MAAIVEEDEMQVTAETIQEIGWRIKKRTEALTNSTGSAQDLIHELQEQGIPFSVFESAVDSTQGIPDAHKTLMKMMYGSEAASLEETAHFWESQGLLN